LALALKSPDARKIVERLVKWADVMIVNTPHPARKKQKLLAKPDRRCVVVQSYAENFILKVL
jgi:hypothetical protein